jgi:transposase
LASLMAACNMNDVDPQTYFVDVLIRIVDRHPMSRLNKLLPFAYVKPVPAKAVV